MGATSSVVDKVGAPKSSPPKTGRGKIPQRQVTGIRYKKETMLELKRKNRGRQSMYVKEKRTHKKELMDSLFAPSVSLRKDALLLYCKLTLSYCYCQVKTLTDISRSVVCIISN